MKGGSPIGSTKSGVICFRIVPTNSSTICLARLTCLGSSMTRKTDGEKIDELERIVSTLVERVDNVRREMIDRERLAVIE